jgi:biopolymer transport protein TolR
MESSQPGGRQRRTALSQINVTPFVDVMLVLLVIFMVTAPMMDKGLDVNLPQVKDAPAMSVTDEPLTVTVGATGAISIGKARVESVDKLGAVLTQATGGNKERQVLLAADGKVPYAQVAKVMAAIRAAGIEKVGMMLQQEEESLK